MLMALGRQFRKLVTNGSEERSEEVVKLPNNQHDFEVAVFEEFAKLNPEIGEIILEQFGVAKVIDCYGTKVGCYTDYHVSDEVKLLPHDTPTHITGPYFWMRGLSDDEQAVNISQEWGTGGTLLMHDSGKISCLECFGHGEGWPTEKYEFEFMKSED